MDGGTVGAKQTMSMDQAMVLQAWSIQIGSARGRSELMSSSHCQGSPSAWHAEAGIGSAGRDGPGQKMAGDRGDGESRDKAGFDLCCCHRTAQAPSCDTFTRGQVGAGSVAQPRPPSSGRQCPAKAQTSTAVRHPVRTWREAVPNEDFVLAPPVMLNCRSVGGGGVKSMEMQHGERHTAQKCAPPARAHG